MKQNTTALQTSTCGSRGISWTHGCSMENVQILRLNKIQRFPFWWISNAFFGDQDLVIADHSKKTSTSTRCTQRATHIAHPKQERYPHTAEGNARFLVPKGGEDFHWTWRAAGDFSSSTRPLRGMSCYATTTDSPGVWVQISWLIKFPTVFSYPPPLFAGYPCFMSMYPPAIKPWHAGKSTSYRSCSHSNLHFIWDSPASYVWLSEEKMNHYSIDTPLYI